MSFLIYFLIILCISFTIIIAVLAGAVAIKDALGWFSGNKGTEGINL